ncbi:MAG: MnhB domain-containing protein [Thermotaleaceae bacterium]
MKTSAIVQTVFRMLFPFVIVFGLYIIIHGAVSPGGGFQGGAVLATALLGVYIITDLHPSEIHVFVLLEKFIFLALVFITCISFFTRGVPFTNFVHISASIGMKRIFLALLNILIGMKVALGFSIIFSTFYEEGKND